LNTDARFFRSTRPLSRADRAHAAEFEGIISDIDGQASCNGFQAAGIAEREN